MSEYSAVAACILKDLPLSGKAEQAMRKLIKAHLNGTSLDAVVGPHRKSWLRKQRKIHLQAARKAFLVRYPDYDKLTDFHLHSSNYMAVHWPKLCTLDKPPSFSDAVQSNLWWACWYGSRLREQPLPTAKSQFNALLNSTVCTATDRTEIDVSQD